MESGRKLLIVCATVWEAKEFLKDFERVESGLYRKAFEDGTVDLAICGIGQDNARRSIQRHLHPAPSCVFSTGFAGGLQKGLSAGVLVLDASRSDRRLMAILESRLAGRFDLRPGTFWSGQRVLLTSEEKLAQGLESGAIAAEMESQALFEVCKEKKIPFLSLRAISDPAEVSLPAAVAQIRPDGGLGIGFWMRLFTRPSQWMALLQLSKNSNQAGKNLAQALSAAAPAILQEES